MPLISKNKYTKKTYLKSAPAPSKPVDKDSDSSDSCSDGDEEDQKDYCVGGYHPVEIGEVFNDKYKVLCKMGWGQYSTVWLVRDISTEKLFALKIQKSASAYMEAAQDEVKLFTEVMKHVRNAREEDPEAVVNIVELEDNFIFNGVNGTHMCFVYERLGGSLLDLIKHYNYKGIPSSIVRRLTADMLSGLSFLHGCNIIHTDLKPENVLLKSPLPLPPPPQTTMYDLLQEQVNGNADVCKLRSQCDDETLSADERKRLRAKLKKLRMKIKKGLSRDGIPSLWGFMKFNYRTISDEQEKIDADASDVAENINEHDVTRHLVESLRPAEWNYPDDCFYIKMYVVCPLRCVEEAFGPRHAYGENSRPDYSEWTFSFDAADDNSVCMFQLRGHGKDKHTRLHDIRHVIMNDFEIRIFVRNSLWVGDKEENILWSLRFDGRRIRNVFSILEMQIPGFRVIHLPNPKFSLSAYEHSMIANASREFLPPATAIFRDLNGSLVGLYLPKVKVDIEVLPLELRLSMWPSDALMSKEVSNNREIPDYFGHDDMVGCKIVDLGNSCFESKKFTLDIQTRQYRCPETILHCSYSYSADIWSAACVIFEMLTGDFLFQPKEHGSVSRDLEQLAMFEEVSGRIPSDFMLSGRKSKEFMKSDGKLKYQREFAPHKIAYRLNKSGLSMDEAALVEDLLLQMLEILPEDRLTAAACLEHPWFSFENSV